MPGELTREGQKLAVDAATGRAAVGLQATWLALLTGDPGKAPTMVALAALELTAVGYARQSVLWTPPTEADPSRSDNGALITFGPFLSDPPLVTHCALVTEQIGVLGVVRMKWTLDEAKDAGLNETIQYPIGALSMGVD